MDSKKWKLTDHWELGYDYECPDCGYRFFIKSKWLKKPKKCPNCEVELR